MNKTRDLVVSRGLLIIIGVSLVFSLMAPAYAFGPYVHQNAMRKAHDTLIAEYPDIPVLWTIGSPWDNIEADLNGPSHGADVDLENRELNSNLPDFILGEYREIKSGFVRHLDGELTVNTSKHARRLCHYIADGMAIGQISGPSLWGWKDDLTDLACEAVSSKRAWSSLVHDWGAGHVEDGLEDFKEAVLTTYATYRKDADKWFRTFPWFPTSRDVTHMTRRGVAQAGTLTSSFILLAWKDATDFYEHPKNFSFEDELEFWKIYGDGTVETTSHNAFNGSLSAHIQRNTETGKYFGLYQKNIAVEPDTEYRLSLWVKTNATGGRAAASFGVWSSDPAANHHSDFGHTSGMSEWLLISGIWKSRPEEHVMRVMLYGTPDFVGEAWFDDLVLEEVP